MPPPTWPLDLDQTLRKVNRSPEAPGLLSFAIWTVEGLYRLVDLDDAVFANPRRLDGYHPDVLDLAHARWATSSAITALDLCAATLGRLYCDVGDYEKSLRSFNTTAKRAPLSGAAQEWIVAVESDLRYQAVSAARKPLTHSFMTRSMYASTQPFHGHTGRLEISVRGQPATRVPVRTLIEWSQQLGTQHVSALLDRINEGAIR